MRYLSLEWIEAMQAHVAASESLKQLASTHSIGVTQVVTDGPEGTIVYHLQVGDGVAEFAAGPASNENVRMEQSWQTSVDVATETVPAQEVFMKGLVKITGDLRASWTTLQSSPLLTPHLLQYAASPSIGS